MMKNKQLLTYRIVTGLFTALTVLGASQYFFNHEMVKGMFEQIEFPVYLIYPMGTAKFLGLIAIWSNKSATLKEWAYAGFFFNFVLGISAHVNVQDGEFWGAAIALIFVVASYIMDRRVYPRIA